MKINLKAMRESGMDVTIEKDSIEILGAPIPAGMHQSLQTLLKTHGLNAMGRDLVTAEFYEALHKAQLLEFVEG